MPNPIILSHQRQHRSAVRLTYRTGAAHGRSYRLLKLLAILGLLLPAMARAQSADEFNPGATSAPGFANVNAIAVQPDGKIVVGGEFTHLGGQMRSRIGRLNADGTVDTSFNAGVVGGTVRALAVQADGKIVIGGVFSQIGGQVRNRIARLNADGTLDMSFNPGVGASGPNFAYVDALALQADGKILVGGDFTQLGGQPRDFIGRLNTNGTLDTSFNPGANNIVFALAVQADGNIVVGGQFTQLGGQQRTYVGRVNASGALDGAFNLGVVSGGPVQVVRVQVDGKILVGGGFTMLGGQPRNSLARFETTGTLDSSFNPGASGGFFPVETLAVQADGKIVVGGQFTQLGGQPRNLIGRIDADGTLDSGFNPGASGTGFSGVLAVAVQTDGRIVVGGQFTELAGQPRNNLGRFNADGTLETAFPDVVTLVSSFVNAIALRPGGKILVGGFFTQLGGQPRNRIGLLNPDGTPDTAFNPGANSSVDSLAVQADGKILVGGFFTQLAGQPRNRVARLNADGALDSSFNDPGATDSGVKAIAVQSDGRIVVGGFFTQLGGQPRSLLGRLDTNGTLDPSFNPGASGGSFPAVYAVAVQSDDKIVVAGQFTQLGGQPRNFIGRLNADGTLDATFNPGVGGFFLTVRSLKVQADDKILVGGFFNQLGGQPRNSIGRLNADGTLDPSFNAGGTLSGTVTAIEVADNKILVGGNFLSLGGQPRERLARLNTDGTLDPTFNPGASGSATGGQSIINAFAVQADGKILVGGEFTQLGGQPRANIGRLHPIPLPPLFAIKAISKSGNTVTITLDSFTGYSYQLQRSLSSLDPAAFSDIGSPQAGSTGSELIFTDSDAADATAFYRVTAGL